MTLLRLGFLSLALTLAAPLAMAAPPATDAPSPTADAPAADAPAADAPAAEPSAFAPARPSPELPVERVDGPPATPPPTDAVVGRTLSTTAAPSYRPFTFWSDHGGRDFIKPVLQLSALLVGYFPESDTNDALTARLSTLAMTRFGLEGELFGWVSFRSVFERNLGFSLARNGPVGTGVWEGTASLSARENYIQLHLGDFTVTGGIFPDPASVDYFSVNVLDALGADPYVRDSLLLTGFNQGQGVMLRYQVGGFGAGLSFTGGNPLTSSLSFGFGGDLSSAGTLYTAPYRQLSNGVPGSDIQMMVVTPSVMYENDVFGVKLAAQYYLVDVNVTNDEDVSANGFNARLTSQVTLLDRHLRLFVSGSFRRNQQLVVTDVSKRGDTFEAFAVGGGADVTYGDFGFGAQFYHHHSEFSDTSNATNQYLNVGITWWLEPPFLSVGLRWGRSMTETEPNDPALKASDSLILSTRLLL